MSKHGSHLGAAFALALCVALGTLADTAAAGNPHGAPPGQAKKAADVNTAVQVTVAPAASASAHVKAHGHAAASGSGHATSHTTVVSHSTVAAHTTITSHSTVTSHTTVAAGTNFPAAASVSGRASAPGRLKKTTQAGTTVGAGASASGRASAPGQLKKSAQAGTTVTSSGTSPTMTAQTQTQLSKFSGCTASPSQGAGVKPNSTTLHWTCAAATSNQTKLYGNALTAGAIAVSRGGAGAMLFGPGNSQPHKVLACVNGKTHLVDVHAVKSYSNSSCQPGAAGVVGSTSPTTSTSVTAAATPPSTSVAASVAANAATSNNAATAGGTKGAEHAKAAAAGKAPAASGTSPASNQGVLGAAANQQLPFTGLQLWLVVLAAAGLIAGGLALRRVGRSVA